MIRRRGKRGRIRRAEAAEAYENRTPIDECARNLQKSEVHAGHNLHIASGRPTCDNSGDFVDSSISGVASDG